MLSEIGNHFREGAVIAKLKLCRLELAGFLIATRIGTAARRNLGNAEFQRPLPDSRFFPSGHDNARVRHGKGAIWRQACSFKVYGGREAKSDPMAGSMRHADGMTADPKPLLKMRDVGHERQRFEPPVI